jgi:hypothetical protein
LLNVVPLRRLLLKNFASFRCCTPAGRATGDEARLLQSGDDWLKARCDGLARSDSERFQNCQIFWRHAEPPCAAEKGEPLDPASPPSHTKIVSACCVREGAWAWPERASLRATRWSSRSERDVLITQCCATTVIELHMWPHQDDSRFAVEGGWDGTCHCRGLRRQDAQQV